MILYNITIKVEESVSGLFCTWLLENHMPAMLATGCFNSSRLLRLLEVDDSDGPTYAVQFTAPTKILYNKYISEHAEAHRRQLEAKWAGQYVSFSSAMELIQ
ncbi:MAG TPA: DUF4286 family protein [Flavihumibacter sp.]|nr:DUF4286 family protein [Flavihumibacter sp.]HPZ89279.1 DUF4286 family protein [Flavihumibacter sp.]